MAINKEGKEIKLGFPEFEKQGIKTNIYNGGILTKGEIDLTFGYGTHIDFLLSEDDKKKDDLKAIKDMVRKIEDKGRIQVNRKRDRIIRLFNIAEGRINKEDYETPEIIDYLSNIDTGNTSETPMLDAFPLVSTIKNALVNELDKQYVDYQAIAVSPDATNEILKQKNDEIKNLLLGKVFDIFNANLSNQGIDQESQPDVYKAQLEIFQKLPEIQKYYDFNFRLEEEIWANNQIELIKRKQNIDTLSRKVFANKIICDEPYLHINLIGNDTKWEVIRPENAFFEMSPNLNDVSESSYFGWFEQETPMGIINKYGSMLKESDVKLLESYNTNTRLHPFSPEKWDKGEDPTNYSFVNYHAMQSINAGHTLGVTNSLPNSTITGSTLLTLTHLYFDVPRKLKKVTIKDDINSTTLVRIVDTSYTPTFSPVYDGEKKEENLVSGEHIEFTIVTEKWRCVKINVGATNLFTSTNPNSAGVNTDNHNGDIYLILEKYPVQLSKPPYKFGSLAPIVGGPNTNGYGEPSSIVSKIIPFYVSFNYVWNRIRQIMETEMGVFLLFNEKAIPKSFDLITWALAAKETGIAPLDTSVGNMEQQSVQVTGGFGQKIDMSRTDEILQKAQLAEVFKRECYSTIGITPQFLGDMSPEQTATSVIQGQARSFAQIQHLYKEHYEMMVKAFNIDIELNQYLQSKYPTTQQTYTTSEGQRVIFEMDTERLSLYKLGVFISTNIEDLQILQDFQRTIMGDNTMGISPIEKLSILKSKSVADTYDRLKSFLRQKESKIEEERQHQIKMQQNDLQAAQQRQEGLLQSQQLELDKKAELELRLAEIKAVGQSQFSEGNGINELVRLRELQLKEDSYYDRITSNIRTSNLEGELKNREMDSKLQVKENERTSNEFIQREKIQLEREKILARMKASNDAVIIAKENKP